MLLLISIVNKQFNSSLNYSIKYNTAQHKTHKRNRAINIQRYYTDYNIMKKKTICSFMIDALFL